LVPIKVEKKVFSFSKNGENNPVLLPKVKGDFEELEIGGIMN
jgi:hypothetical protein